MQPAQHHLRAGIHVYLGNAGQAPIAPHWHDGVELHVLLAGAASHTVGAHTWQLVTGDCLLMGGSAAHSHADLRPGRIALWQFDPNVARRLAARTTRALAMPIGEHYRESAVWPPRRLTASDLACVRALSQRALELLDAVPSTRREQTLVGLASAVVALVAAADEPPARAAPASDLTTVLAAIRRRPDANWTRSVVLERTGLDRNQLAAAMQRAVGVGLRGFVRQQRLALARQLLRAHPGQPISEIAVRCGFGSLPGFSSAFRQVVGVSPSAWREADAADRSSAGDRLGQKTEVEIE